MIILILVYSNYVIFNPVKATVWTPDVPYTDLMIGGIIHAQYFEFNADGPILLFSHGNNANISVRKYAIDIARRYNVNLILYDYEGYGQSKGSPDQGKILKDAEMVYDWVRAKYSPERIILWGESLGSSPATHLGVNKQAKALVIFAGFSSISDLIPGTLGDVTSMFINTLSNKDIIGKIKCPVCFIHSKEDTYVPYINALRNYERVVLQRKQLVTILGDHATPKMTYSQMDSVMNFVGVETPWVSSDEYINFDEINVLPPP
jgi:pimeloyl-ACP methyl ester carboxylesterase